MAKCENCKGEGYKDRTICEQGYLIDSVKEWCQTCKGNGHIPPIITMEQYCSVKSDGEREQMYKPPKFENPYADPYHDREKCGNSLCRGELVKQEAYEAGADAMLEGLRKGGVYRDNEPFDAPRNTGTWVFIPEERE